MTGFKTLLLTAVPFLALQTGGVLSDEPALYTKHTASRVDCREAMNAIRSEAGLPGFAAPTEEDSKLPVVETPQEEDNASRAASSGVSTDGQANSAATGQTAQANFLNNFCSSLSAAEASEKEQTTDKGTYMVAPATSSGMESCTAAVEFWAEAKNNFTSLPPAYSTSDPLYKDDRNISFVGLFNPRTNPAIDCALITCKAQSAGDEDAPTKESNAESLSPTMPGSQSTPAENTDGGKDAEKERERRLEAAENVANFLICLSSPQALQNTEAPFTQEQWDKIKGVENSSPSPRLFAAVALGAAALMHYAF